MDDLIVRRGQALAALSLRLAAAATDRTRLEDEVVRAVAELIGDAAALWRKDEGGDLLLAAFHHPDPGARAEMARLVDGITHDTTSGFIGGVWRASVPVVLDAEGLRAAAPAMHPAYREYFAGRGGAGLALLPLRVRGVTVAVLGVSRDRPPAPGATDVEFLTQVGAVVAVALDNERLLTQVRDHLGQSTRAHRAAHRAALHDALTGLPNRRVLMDRLASLRSREHGGPAALLLLDLDGFKQVNDAHGHEAGDGVLVEVAARLAETLAGHPLADRATLVRLGGDEFAVLLPSVPGTQAAVSVATALFTAMQEPLARLSWLPARRSLSASIGVAVAGPELAAGLLREADVAMYRAKRHRLGVAVYERDLDGAAALRLRDVAELDEAITRGHLLLHYQPFVAHPAVQTGTTRVEGLVRWQHPQRGLLPPSAFLGVAAQSGLLLPLTRVVLDQALGAVRSWADDGLRVAVSVNVPAAFLADPTTPAALQVALDRAGLDASALCLELTESDLLEGGPGVVEHVRTTGVRVSIDDFGTGYSALSYLADLAVDEIKLDRSFVARGARDTRTRHVLRSVVGCALDLGVEVVVEGIETEDEQTLAAELSAQWQQGFRHAVPLQAEALGEWVAARS